MVSYSHSDDICDGGNRGGAIRCSTASVPFAGLLAIVYFSVKSGTTCLMRNFTLCIGKPWAAGSRALLRHHSHGNPGEHS